MIELTSIESFPLSFMPGVTVYMVAAPFEMDRGKPEITGQTIILDGKTVKVEAVERYMPATPIHVGEIIGLLIKSS